MSIILISSLTGCSSQEKDLQNLGISVQDWAFVNNAQPIKGVVGSKGIDLNILSTWEITKGKENIVIAIIDSGCDIELSVLSDRLYYNSEEVPDYNDDDMNGHIDDYLSWNFCDNTNNVYDEYLYDYHGTYIATAIARTAQNCKILPVKFMSGTVGKLEDAIKAISYAIDRGTNIINCSWNFQDYSEDLYELIKNNENVLFVVSAGNSNVDIDKIPLYPCSCDLDNIITVTAMDNNGQLCHTAGYGETVDIAAPGVDIYTIFPENDLDFVSGTSIATAFVSATAGLMYSVDASLLPSDVKEIIISTASFHDELSEKCGAKGYLNTGNCVKAVHEKLSARTDKNS